VRQHGDARLRERASFAPIQHAPGVRLPLDVRRERVSARILGARMRADARRRTHELLCVH
jgi:hypothetical protein